jgi:sugar lactone lactonase YvrE
MNNSTVSTTVVMTTVKAVDTDELPPGCCHGPSTEFLNVFLKNKGGGVAVDKDGNVIKAFNQRIHKITPQGQVITLAGTGASGYQDGEGTVAQFNFPTGVALDGDGNVIVADSVNNRIRKITPQGQVSTLAGSGQIGKRDDGDGSRAQFNNPMGVAVDGDGNVIVADTLNHRVRHITPQGQVFTLVGSSGQPSQNNSRNIPPTGPQVMSRQNGHGSVAQFEHPIGVAVDKDGNLLVADLYNQRIRKIKPHPRDARDVSTLAGTNNNKYAYAGTNDYQ